ncbi:MAG: condensation domain-containing protein [Conexibacter sp.]
MDELVVASISQARSFRVGLHSNRNIPIFVRFRGPLDRAALAGALIELFRRHSALRTKLTERGGQIWQLVSAEPPALPASLREAPVSIEPAALEATLASLAELPFWLEDERLVRVALLAAGRDDHALVLVMHHSLCDGWSVNVIVQELRELYDAHLHRRSPELPPPGATLVEYAQDERPRVSAPSALAAWREHLIPCPPRLALPLVDLPAGRDAVQVREQVASLAADAVAQLRELARRTGATLTTVLLAAVARTLAPYGNGHLTLNVEHANRLQARYLRTVGPFGANVALRMVCDQDATDIALRRARDEWLDAVTRWVWLADLVALVEDEATWPQGASPLEIDVNHLPRREGAAISHHGSTSIEVIARTSRLIQERVVCPERPGAFGVLFAEREDGSLRLDAYWLESRLPADLCRDLVARIGETLTRFSLDRRGARPTR